MVLETIRLSADHQWTGQVCHRGGGEPTQQVLEGTAPDGVRVRHCHWPFVVFVVFIEYTSGKDVVYWRPSF